MVALRRKKKMMKRSSPFAAVSLTTATVAWCSPLMNESLFLRRTSLVVMETHSFFAITLACHYNCYVKEIFTYGIIT